LREKHASRWRGMLLRVPFRQAGPPCGRARIPLGRDASARRSLKASASRPRGLLDWTVAWFGWAGQVRPLRMGILVGGGRIHPAPVLRVRRTAAARIVWRGCFCAKIPEGVRFAAAGARRLDGGLVRRAGQVRPLRMGILVGGGRIHPAPVPCGRTQHSGEHAAALRASAREGGRFAAARVPRLDRDLIRPGRTDPQRGPRFATLVA
jgi:hypothetical protein